MMAMSAITTESSMNEYPADALRLCVLLTCLPLQELTLTEQEVRQAREKSHIHLILELARRDRLYERPFCHRWPTIPGLTRQKLITSASDDDLGESFATCAAASGNVHGVKLRQYHLMI
jgi:hypothetical protein